MRLLPRCHLFLGKSVRYIEVSAIKHVRYREVIEVIERILHDYVSKLPKNRDLFSDICLVVPLVLLYSDAPMSLAFRLMTGSRDMTNILKISQKLVFL